MMPEEGASLRKIINAMYPLQSMKSTRAKEIIPKMNPCRMTSLRLVKRHAAICVDANFCFLSIFKSF